MDHDEIQNLLETAVQESADFLYDKQLFDEKLDKIWDQYGLHPNSTQSWIRNIHTRHVQRTTSSVKANVPSLINNHSQTASSWIVELAQQVNYPPYLLARFILEHYLQQQQSSSTKNTSMSQHVTQCMRDCAAQKSNADIPAALLPAIQHVLTVDPLYGPRHDYYRHMLGIAHEVRLEEFLRQQKLSFATEATLRAQGNAKTPDIVLTIPIAIYIDNKYHQIAWIDSKALYGSVQQHEHIVEHQARSYVHRFGPGMILYWLGHAPVELLSAEADVVVASALPTQYLLPTGTVVRVNDTKTSTSRPTTTDTARDNGTL